MRDLRALPKAHLHLHTEGSMRPSTLLELAEVYGIPAPEMGVYESFAAFDAIYGTAVNVLKTEADLRRLYDEIVDDAADDGAVWVEPAFCPPMLPWLGESEHVLEIAIDALKSACQRRGIDGGFLLTINRADVGMAAGLADLAARYAGKGVVSFGLANDENIVGPEPFAEAYKVAKDAGLLAAPHAGEMAGADSVRRHVEYLNADRLEHGVRGLEDPAVLEMILERDICLDVCLTSNVLLSVVPNMEEHPLPRLLDAGVSCSLNADDSLLFGPGLLDEYENARNAVKLDDVALAGIAAASIAHSGAPDSVKREAKVSIADWLTK
ncbi:adenosine deaminase [Kribbella turkmenica]|uniref:Adenosine deaminase n=1 Tax=Kribbella turkmenica TaxID=2530375 RepID=A0A4R4XFM0_9ACTN|nr:adenosine deaminase [Kribbella turkmenica]